ncbi:MAG: hypothetical protein ACJ75P_02780 [Gaiellaceae bacterium]
MPVKTLERRPRAPASAEPLRRPAAPTPQDQILALQRSAGNAAVGRVLQRDWYDYVPSPLNPLGVVGKVLGVPSIGSFGSVTDPLGGVFEAAIQTNRAMADRISVPDLYRRKLLEYAEDEWLDGAILIRALERSPRFYKGGWILDVQSDAKAMTLDNYVFVDGDLRIEDYIHELVHVTQYATTGRTHFLTSYFGLSALTIAKRFIMREPINMMRSSPHENQAYDLEQRFLEWYATHK